MNKQVILLCVLMLALPLVANGEELEGDYLYKVTSIRDAAARHSSLIANGEQLFAFYEDHFAYGPSWSKVD